jgi:hypothetical protein
MRNANGNKTDHRFSKNSVEAVFAGFIEDVNHLIVEQ